MKKYISIVHGLCLYPDIWPVPQNAQCILHKKHHLGKAIPAEIYMKDLLLMKQNNINTVRTSHYPNDVKFYAMMDLSLIHIFITVSVVYKFLKIYP